RSTRVKEGDDATHRTGYRNDPDERRRHHVRRRCRGHRPALRTPLGAARRIPPRRARHRGRARRRQRERQDHAPPHHRHHSPADPRERERVRPRPRAGGGRDSRAGRSPWTHPRPLRRPHRPGESRVRFADVRSGADAPGGGRSARSSRPRNGSRRARPHVLRRDAAPARPRPRAPAQAAADPPRRALRRLRCGGDRLRQRNPGGAQGRGRRRDRRDPRPGPRRARRRPLLGHRPRTNHADGTGPRPRRRRGPRPRGRPHGARPDQSTGGDRMSWRAELTRAAALAWKDLTAERRTKANFNAVVFLAGMILLLFGFAFGPDAAALRAAAAGVLWLTVLFSGVLAFNRSYQLELENGALEQLLLYPGSRKTIFLGKLAANLAFVFLVEAIVVPVAAILYDLPLARPFP